MKINFGIIFLQRLKQNTKDHE